MSNIGKLQQNGHGVFVILVILVWGQVILQFGLYPWIPLDKRSCSLLEAVTRKDPDQHWLSDPDCLGQKTAENQVYCLCMICFDFWLPDHLSKGGQERANVDVLFNTMGAAEVMGQRQARLGDPQNQKQQATNAKSKQDDA
jgi:hypothetical protein